MTQVPALLNEIVCWPLRVDLICGLGNVFPATDVTANVCDPSNVIDADFGKDYVRLKEMERQLTSPAGFISLNYTEPKLSVAELINGTSRAIQEKLEVKSRYVLVLLRVIDRFMLLIYLKVIYGKTSFLP